MLGIYTRGDWAAASQHSVAGGGCSCRQAAEQVARVEPADHHVMNSHGPEEHLRQTGITAEDLYAVFRGALWVKRVCTRHVRRCANPAATAAPAPPADPSLRRCPAATPA